MSDALAAGAATTAPYELYGRLVRLIEALIDGDADFALALACDLERDLAAPVVETRAAA